MAKYTYFYESQYTVKNTGPYNDCGEHLSIVNTIENEHLGVCNICDNKVEDGKTLSF